MGDARTKTTIRVDNIHHTLTKETLHAHFVPFGEIVDIDLPMRERGGTHKGYAHIEFEDQVDAAAAQDNMDHAEIYDTVIRVAPAKPVREAFEGLGSKVPLWEQEGFIQQYMAKEDGQDDAMTGLEQQHANSGPQPDLPVSVGPMQAKED